jgi:hypothetical protein
LLSAVLMSERSAPKAEAGSQRITMVTLSPIILDEVLLLVNNAAGLGLDIFDSNGYKGSDACFVAVALRTATGDEEGVDALDPDGNGIPCDGDQIPATEITAEDFTLLDPLDAEQVSETSEGYFGGLFIMAFDSDPEGKPVQFDATDGSFHTILNGFVVSAGEHITCDEPGEDPDCQTTQLGGFKDGAATVAFSGPFDKRGDVTVTASIVGENDSTSITIKGVGEPEELVPLLNLDPKLEAGGTGVCKPGGNDFTFQNLLQITTLAGLPDAGLVAVQVKDADGTGLTLIPVEWESRDEDILVPGFDEQFSLFNSGLLLGPNLMCSGPSPGEATVDVSVRRGPNGQGSVSVLRTELSWTVIGRPAQMVAYAEPATIDCNGVNTTNVNVHVLDARANPGVGGRDVRFDLQVLGTANPIVATTNGDGVATSVVTPLAQEGTTGVPVIITGPLEMATTVMVNCQVGAGTGVPGTGSPPPTTGGGAGGAGTGRPGGIIGPDTGTGGLGGGLPVWPAVALFVAAMGLIGARYGLTRPR